MLWWRLGAGCSVCSCLWQELRVERGTPLHGQAPAWLGSCRSAAAVGRGLQPCPPLPHCHDPAMRLVHLPRLIFHHPVDIPAAGCCCPTAPSTAAVAAGLQTGWRHTHRRTQHSRCCTTRPRVLLGPCPPLPAPVPVFGRHPCRAPGVLDHRPPLVPDPFRRFPLVPGPSCPGHHRPPPAPPHEGPCLPRLGHGHPCRTRPDLAHPGLRCPPPVQHAAAAALQSAPRPAAALAAAGTAAVAAACSHSRAPRGTGAGLSAAGHPRCRRDCHRHRLACQSGLHVHLHHGHRIGSALYHLPTDSAPDSQTSDNQSDMST